MAKVPLQLILEKELMNNQIKNILFYHNTDRWYFGDLLRHSSWIESLGKIGANLAVSTNKNFLSIFENHPFVKKIISVDEITEKNFSKYDLVVIPSSFPPKYYSPFIKRGIYSYNSTIVYTRHGIVVNKIKKLDLNYFDLANHKFGQTYLPNGEYFKIHLANDERIKSDKIIKKLFPKNENIIIFNPTSSNTFTRETSIKKEVPNILNFEDCVSILENLVRKFPEYSILIASSIKSNDRVNFELIEKLGKSELQKVKSITSITNLEKGFSFRDFASVMSNKRIIAMLGNGTGTSAHFAATCDLPSMSIERSADTEVIKNWENDSFHIGVLRWRNPKLLTLTYSLDWLKKNENDFKKIVNAFKLHVIVSQNKWGDFFCEKDLARIAKASKEILFLIQTNKVLQIGSNLRVIKDSFKNVNTKDFYFDFYNEITYLNILNKKNKQIFGSIIVGEDVSNYKCSLADKRSFLELIKNSNLYKLIIHISGGKIEEKTKEKNTSDVFAIDILKKIRAGVLLSRSDLRKIDFESELGFHNWINKSISKDIERLVNDCKKNKNKQIKDSWQQRVYVDSKINAVLKIIDINKKSIYLTKKHTIKSIKISASKAGGFVPFHSELKRSSKEYAHVSSVVTPLMSPVALSLPALNNKFFNPNSINKQKLSTGFIDEFIDNFIGLAKSNIYNFDCRFIEIGVDKFGVFYTVDSGSFEIIKSLVSDTVLVKDFIHLGINQLARNRVLFNKFKNGSELVGYYDKQIKDKLKIDLSDFSLEWEWGDHGNPKIKPVAQILKKSLFSFRKKTAKPVYPLINNNFQKIIVNIIKKRFSKTKELVG